MHRMHSSSQLQQTPDSCNPDGLDGRISQNLQCRHRPSTQNGGLVRDCEGIG